MPRIGKNALGRTTKRKINSNIQRIHLTFAGRTPVSQVITSKNRETVHPDSAHCRHPQETAENCSISSTSVLFKSSGSSKRCGINNSEETSDTIINKLRSWSVRHNVKGSTTSALLRILKAHDCFKELPVDSRTLLQTPRHINLCELSPGKYCHFGLVKCFKHILKISYLDSVTLQFNVDGLPISRSSSHQFWPILAHITELPKSRPFAVGIYYGEDKPKSSNDFLRRFIEELVETRKVVLDDGREVQVKIHSFVCDAPARAFLVNVKGHTGYYGCQKCTVEEDYISHRITFQETECELRTDYSFRQKLNEEHHLEFDSELLKLPIDIIRQIPLDYQHLVCLGVVRKLIYLWLKGKRKQCRLPFRDTHLISRRLIELKRYICCEFSRKPRSLLHVNNWKATEYRTFLLYTGPVVLKGILPELYYTHFLVLHVAITIFCSKTLQAKLLSYATKLLKYFVEVFGDLYGNENVSYNVHNLLHLSDDSSRFGVLDNFSTFIFENFLGKLKLLLRSGNRPLEQAFNRLTESQLINNIGLSDNTCLSIRYQSKHG